MSERLPGAPLMEGYGYWPYSFDEHRRSYGQGYNFLRTPRLAQPRALRAGDMLATGELVLSKPREGGKGLIWVHLTGGQDGHWIEVPSRLPIALLTREDDEEMWRLKEGVVQMEHDRVTSSSEIPLL